MSEHAEPLDVLYRDNNCVVVNKPRGMLVHRSELDRHENQFLLQTLRDQLQQHLFPIHRLDKPTSGAVIFAFSAEAAKYLQAQMESLGTKKYYLLVCRGFCPERGEINHPLKPVNDFRRTRAKAVSKEAKPAVTHFERLATLELPVAIDKYPSSRYSLVKARLLTGRRHQIRRHFKHISHPIIGCPKYGKSLHNRYFAEHLNAPGLLLHAWQLVFTPPEKKDTITVTAPLPKAFAGVAEHFAIDL